MSSHLTGIRNLRDEVLENLRADRLLRSHGTRRRSNSDALLFGRLWYGEPNAASNAIGYAKFYSRSHDAVIRVYDDSGNVIETHENKGEFKEW
jgi:hypothetical protein